jgi:hypothetical protein
MISSSMRLFAGWVALGAAFAALNVNQCAAAATYLVQGWVRWGRISRFKNYRWENDIHECDVPISSCNRHAR